MMNSQSSSRWQLLRYATVLPLALGLLLTSSAVVPTASVAQGQSLQQGTPLYFLDGKRVEKSEVDKVDPKTVESVDMLKGAAATKAFGPEAAGGAVLIVTKQNKDSEQVKKFMQQHSIVLNPERKDTKPSLYFLDGQPSDAKTIEAVNPRTIASVSMVKGPDAARTFGAGAADGVMVVVTKRNVGSEAVAEFNRRYHIEPPLVPAPPAAPAPASPAPPVRP